MASIIICAVAFIVGMQLARRFPPRVLVYSYCGFVTAIVLVFVLSQLSFATVGESGMIVFSPAEVVALYQNLATIIVVFCIMVGALLLGRQKGRYE